MLRNPFWGFFFFKYIFLRCNGHYKYSVSVSGNTKTKYSTLSVKQWHQCIPNSYNSSHRSTMWKCLQTNLQWQLLKRFNCSLGPTLVQSSFNRKVLIKTKIEIWGQFVYWLGKRWFSSWYIQSHSAHAHLPVDLIISCQRGFSCLSSRQEVVTTGTRPVAVHLGRDTIDSGYFLLLPLQIVDRNTLSRWHHLI